MKRTILAVCVCALLAGCGTSAAAKDSTVAPDARALEASVRSYVEVFGKGDGAGAWAQVSARCTAKITEVDYRATVAAAGVKYPGLHVTHYSAHIDGSAATVTYTTSAAELSYDGQRWVFEGGAWHWDGC